MSTQYKDIQGFPGYRVGDDGTVWSCRACRNFSWGEWRILKPRYYNKKHPYQSVSLMKECIPHQVKVHHLVLDAFIGPRPEGHEAIHRDSNPDNNALDNLRWGTKTENGMDMRLHGMKKGEHHGMSKLTDDMIRSIRIRYASGETQSAIAKDFGVHQSTISLAVNHQQWSHVV